MKLSNRAKSALATAGYSVSEESAIAQLVAFAAQNSGIEPENYGLGRGAANYARGEWKQAWASFQSERRSISEDWRRVKQALQIAATDGVTDADVIAEAPHAFSGRLEWVNCLSGFGDERDGKIVNVLVRGEHTSTVDAPDYRAAVSNDRLSGYWDYCTGQYFPTEYRKAAATLLEYATRKVRQSRPPEKRKVTTIGELKALNVKNGGCWFNPGEMRFFGTRIESGILRGKYFITSEQPPHGARKYSVRSFDDEGDIETVGEFCSHNSKADAMAAMPAA